MAHTHLTSPPSLTRLPALTYVAALVDVTMDSIGERVVEALDELERYMASRGIDPAGPSLIRYRALSEHTPFMIEVGWITAEGLWIDAPYVADVLPEGHYATATHVGPYGALGDSTDELLRWADAEGVTFAVANAPGVPAHGGDLVIGTESAPGGEWGCWYELYVTDPVESPAGPWGTVEIRMLTAP
ncbi:MAG: hypothetical protein CVT64_00900 [Actinobacteria bacterium HGW-Actinobacteria-4]|nr:MAG: hypothetical protein CVT64_00900 [Actinobacteria bacterium HGW-Actinobacteria-4]